MESTILTEDVYNPFFNSQDIIKNSMNMLELKTNAINREIDGIKEFFKFLLTKSIYFRNKFFF